MKWDILNKSLKERKIINYANYTLEDKDLYHIAYGIDDNFVMPMGISMISILENNQDIKIVFNVLIEQISDENIAKLEHLARKYRCIIYIHFINGDIFDKLPYTDHFSKATYNRFLLTKILKNITERVIYIDADILCYGSIIDLKNIDFKENIIIAVQDIGPVANRQIKQLKMKSNLYFNAGFLYIDILSWEKNKISEKALNFSFEHLGKLNWLDQDALNFILDNKVLFIDKKYDYIFDFGDKKNKNIKEIPKNIVFVHYAGRYKPWHQWCMHPLKRDFLKYKNDSIWKTTQIVQPTTYKDMKKMAKSFMEYNNICQGIYWYFKYSYNKIMSKLG